MVQLEIVSNTFRISVSFSVYRYQNDAKCIPLMFDLSKEFSDIDFPCWTTRMLMVMQSSYLCLNVLIPVYQNKVDGVQY